jgi:hypothetical protein
MSRITPEAEVEVERAAAASPRPSMSTTPSTFHIRVPISFPITMFCFLYGPFAGIKKHHRNVFYKAASVLLTALLLGVGDSHVFIS